jgi:hypothetical protein
LLIANADAFRNSGTHMLEHGSLRSFPTIYF